MSRTIDRDTKQRISQAALEQLALVGPARLTVSGVAHRAGMSRGTVYRYFTDRDALVTAVTGHLADQLDELLVSNAAAAGAGSDLARVLDGRLHPTTRKSIEMLRELQPGFTVEFAADNHDALVAQVDSTLRVLYAGRRSLPIEIEPLAEIVGRVLEAETLCKLDRSATRQLLLSLSQLIDEKSDTVRERAIA
ncbi:MAG: putative transcriptional regulator, family [Ilumatobacteraceae bacterium]|nr:putative transcriptional regulator, family [Ilumatobacteraceae bacterium]